MLSFAKNLGIFEKSEKWMKCFIKSIIQDGCSLNSKILIFISLNMLVWAQEKFCCFIFPDFRNFYRKWKSVLPFSDSFCKKWHFFGLFYLKGTPKIDFLAKSALFSVVEFYCASFGVWYMSIYAKLKSSEFFYA